MYKFQLIPQRLMKKANSIKKAKPNQRVLFKCHIKVMTFT